MISLRAISTSRKRGSRLLLAALFLFAAIAPLQARDYRIGLALVGDEGRVYSMLCDVISFASSSVTRPDLAEAAVNRDEKLLLLEDDKARSKALRAEEIYEPKETEKDESPFSSVLVPLSLDRTELSFVSAGDESAIEYIKGKNDLDELLLVTISEEAGLAEIEIDADGEEIAFFLYSESIGGEETVILPFFLSRYRDGKLFTVRAEGNVAATISENGETVPRYGDYLVLTEGKHRLDITAVGYGTCSVDVVAGDETSCFSYELLPSLSIPLFVSSNPYPDYMVYRGRRIENSTYIAETSLPFALSVVADGYLTRTIQSGKETGFVQIRMLPTSLYDPGELEEKKGVFYSYLLGTLLSFGLSVASGSIDNLMPDTDLSLLTTGLYGMTITGVVLMVDSLFDYKNALFRSY